MQELLTYLIFQTFLNEIWLGIKWTNPPPPFKKILVYLKISGGNFSTHFESNLFFLTGEGSREIQRLMKTLN